MTLVRRFDEVRVKGRVTTYVGTTKCRVLSKITAHSHKHFARAATRRHHGVRALRPASSAAY